LVERRVRKDFLRFSDSPELPWTQRNFCGRKVRSRCHATRVARGVHHTHHFLVRGRYAPHDSRTTSCGVTNIVRAGRVGSVIRSSMARKAVIAMSRAGCRMVVKETPTRVAYLSSSKLTTRRSSGTRILFLSSERSKWAAVKSEAQAHEFVGLFQKKKPADDARTRRLTGPKTLARARLLRPGERGQRNPLFLEKPPCFRRRQGLQLFRPPITPMTVLRAGLLIPFTGMATQFI